MTAAARRSRAIALLLAGVFAAVALLGVALSAARAAAVFQEITESGRPGYLRLAAHTTTPLQATLGPGESMRWLLRASLLDAELGTLAIELDASGELLGASAMTAQVVACTGAFRTGAHAGADLSRVPCSGERAVVLPATPLSQLAQRDDRFELAELRRGEPRQLLVQLSVPAEADAEAVAGRVARVGLGVHASGEGGVRPVTPVEGHGPRLPVTGADAVALGVLAVGLGGLGASLTLRGRAGRAGRTDLPREAS
ncbi:hypothetical protein [Leucobacter sp.]